MDPSSTAARPAASEVIALLPIKEHSQRVPLKNFRPFAGSALFLWVLRILLEVRAVRRVVINTDATGTIERVIGEAGLADRPVVVRDRDPAIRGDAVSMNRIIADDVAATSAGTFLMTHATNPLLSVDTVERALSAYGRAMADGSADSLFSVTRHQARFYDHRGEAINHDPQRLIQTQDLDPLFEENSLLYVFSRESFEATGRRIGKRPLIFETPPMESIDIDEESDWRIAETLAGMRAR